MPLYTYVVIFEKDSCVVQGRHSNFKGFVSSWSAELPENAMKSLTPTLRRELSQKAYSGDFAAVPNRSNVWKKTIELGGSPLTVYAIQTET